MIAMPLWAVWCFGVTAILPWVLLDSRPQPESQSVWPNYS